MSITIVIPCYNEAENLPSLIQKVAEVKTFGVDVDYILVDNGSTDNTKQVLAETPRPSNFSVVTVPINIGYGYGLQQGIKAAKSEYIGWIHADMQCRPCELEKIFCFFDCRTKAEDDRLFIKGTRRGRSLFDCFFTFGQTAFSSLMFGKKLNDIGAIPVVAQRSLFENIDLFPNDFSFELYAFKKAKEENFHVFRVSVYLEKRSAGTSSWNKGLKSKLKQSRRIFKDTLLIKCGEKVY